MEPFVGCSTNPSLRKRRENMKEDKTRADWVTWKQPKTQEKQQNWNCPPTHHANGALLSLLLLFSALSHTHTLSLNLSKYKDLTAILTNPIQAKTSLSPKIQQSDCNPDKPNSGENQQSHKSTNFANWQWRVLYENMRSCSMPYKLNPCALHIGR